MPTGSTSASGGSYEALREAFEWEVPETFNMATYLCDRWAGSESGTDDGGGDGRAANGLADFLAARGVSRGDRVGVNVPRKPETVIAHLAAWKLGAVSVPLSTLFGPDALAYRLDDSGALACVVDASNVDTLREVRGDLDALGTVVTVDAAPNEGEINFEDVTGTGRGPVGSESGRDGCDRRRRGRDHHLHLGDHQRPEGGVSRPPRSLGPPTAFFHDLL